MAAFTSGLDVAGSRMMRMYIAEFKALGPSALSSFCGACAAVAAIAIVARVIVAVRRRERAPVDAWHFGLLLLFAVLGMRSLRFLPYLALAAALPLLLLVDEAMPRLRSPRALTALAMVALLGLAVVARRGAPFALGYDERVVPVAAVDFAHAHGLDGPVLDSFEFGGYLLYRGVPVLVDGRLDTIYPPPFVALCIQAERKPELLRRLPLDKVGWALGSDGDQRWTHRCLYGDPRGPRSSGARRRRSTCAAISTPSSCRWPSRRSIPRRPSWPAANAVRSRDPARLARARNELSRMLAASPTSARANRALAIYFHLLGRTVERDTVLRALSPEDAAELERRFTSSATTTAN